MVELLLIGIGTGNPDHLTRQATTAIRDADLILIPRKGSAKSDLADLRHQIVERALGDHPPNIAEFDLPVRDQAKGYFEAVSDWHDAIAKIWHRAISDANPAPKTVALLIWGDPSLYDSSLRIAARLRPAPHIRVIPGITSLQALTAAHAIPLNEIGSPVLVTTGRRLAEDGWPETADTVAVMLDGKCSFATLDVQNFDIWWGAYLGMAEQITASGHLHDVADEIVKTRAAARARHGWIMDCYLLRRRTDA